MQNFGPDLMDPPLGGCFSAQEFSFADQSLKKWVGKQHVHKEYLKKSTYLSMNGVAVAPHGLILSQGEATTSRNLSKDLPAPREAIFCPKQTKNTTNTNKLKISGVGGMGGALNFLCWLFPVCF